LAVSLRCGRILFFIALLAAPPRLAFADAGRDKAAARSAAEAGADAFEQGQFERALELFSRAEQLVHAPPHLLFMARSQEKLGRLVDAHESYLKILNEPLPANAPPAFKSARTHAEAEVGAIEARIAYVTVNVRGGDDAKQAVLSMDRTDLPPAAAGIPIPTDPGSHVFSAHTARSRSDEVTVNVRDGTKETVELTLFADPNAPPLAASTAPVAAAAGDPAPQPNADTSSSPAQRVFGFVALGVGAAGVGVGTYFVVSALNAHDKGDTAYTTFGCPACTPEQQHVVEAHDDDAKKARNWAIGSYAVGTAGIVTGLVLLLTDHPSAAAPAAQGRGPLRNVRVGAGFRSVVVSGQF
jgi:hypothetical protein